MPSVHYCNSLVSGNLKMKWIEVPGWKILEISPSSLFKPNFSEEKKIKMNSIYEDRYI